LDLCALFVASISSGFFLWLFSLFCVVRDFQRTRCSKSGCDYDHELDVAEVMREMGRMAGLADEMLRGDAPEDLVKAQRANMIDYGEFPEDEVEKHFKRRSGYRIGDFDEDSLMLDHEWTGRNHKRNMDFSKGDLETLRCLYGDGCLTERFERHVAISSLHFMSQMNRVEASKYARYPSYFYEHFEKKERVRNSE